MTIGERAADHRLDHFLTGSRCLPDLGHVVPDVVGMDEAAGVGRERPDELGAVGDGAEHVTGTPVVADEVDHLPRPTDPLQLADQPRPVRRDVAHPAVRRGRAESGRRQQDDVVDAAGTQFGDEQRPDRVDFGVAVDEDLGRHE